MFGKKDEKDVDFFESDDRLIVFDDDKKTCDVVYVTEITDQSVVSAGRYVVDREECEVTTSPEGRVYFYRAPTRSVMETERLARLEQSIVLKQITNYKPEPLPNPNLDMRFWAVIFLLFVAIVIAAF